MKQNVELKAGDPCPQCGGEMVPDPAHDPKTLADLRNRNSDRPDVAARYERQVNDKAERAGVIHRCVRCGYQARYAAAASGGGTRAGESTRGAVGDLADDRPAGTSDDAEAGRAGEVGARGSNTAARARR